MRERRRGGRTGSRCEGETPSRGGDWLQHGARGQNKDDGFFPRPRGGRRWNMQKEGTCRRANAATCPFRVIRSRTHPETRFSSLLITPPRHARRAARRSGAPSTRAHSPAPALRTATQPTRSAGARARRRRSDGRGFFSPLRPAGASSVTELRRKQVHSAEVGSARPDPKRGNRCERRAFRNATPPRPGQDSSTPRTRTHLRLGGTGSVA